MSSNDDNDDRSVFTGGDEPVTKKQKTYEADGPIEDDKTAREKLREVGFDPDDVHTARSDFLPEKWSGAFSNVTPMAYFAAMGDLPMCRYLFHVRGASTRAAAKKHLTSTYMGGRVHWYPMYSAVVRNQVEAAKWLFCNGAKDDAVISLECNRPTPLILCFQSLKEPIWSDERKRIELAQWFILNGALDASPGEVDKGISVACCGATVRRCILANWDAEDYRVTFQNVKHSFMEVKPILLSFSEDLLMQTDAFHTFLLGTIPAPKYSIDELKLLLIRKLGNEEAASIVLEDVVANGNGRALWDKLQSDIGRPKSSNLCLSAHPGILERIGAYVGFVKSKT